MSVLCNSQYIFLQQERFVEFMFLGIVTSRICLIFFEKMKDLRRNYFFIATIT